MIHSGWDRSGFSSPVGVAMVYGCGSSGVGGNSSARDLYEVKVAFEVAWWNVSTAT